jgi:hypothetical protein
MRRDGGRKIEGGEGRKKGRRKGKRRMCEGELLKVTSVFKESLTYPYVPS